MDPREPTINAKYQTIIPDFVNQYSTFKEEIDPGLPTPKMKKIPINIFTDANHANDKQPANL